jgi:hypothetical protein
MVPTNGTRESEGRSMSDEERRQIIGKTVSDHESAKRHLATLQANAKPMSEFLYLVGSALTEQAGWVSASRRQCRRRKEPVVKNVTNVRGGGCAQGISRPLLKFSDGPVTFYATFSADTSIPRC